MAVPVALVTALSGYIAAKWGISFLPCAALCSESSAVCISKVSWHHFSSFLRCPFRRHVSRVRGGLPCLGPGPSSVEHSGLCRRPRFGSPCGGCLPFPAVPGLSCTLQRAAERRMSEQGKGSASASAAAPAPGSDTYKGWLFKWTNYLKGYQRRWFVLSNGLLSYYR